MELINLQLIDQKRWTGSGLTQERMITETVDGHSQWHKDGHKYNKSYFSKHHI